MQGFAKSCDRIDARCGSLSPETRVRIGATSSKISRLREMVLASPLAPWAWLIEVVQSYSSELMPCSGDHHPLAGDDAPRSRQSFAADQHVPPGVIDASLAELGEHRLGRDPAGPGNGGSRPAATGTVAVMGRARTVDARRRPGSGAPWNSREVLGDLIAWIVSAASTRTHTVGSPKEDRRVLKRLSTAPA